MPLLTLDNKPLVLKGDGGGGQQPCELTITFESPDDTNYIYVDDKYVAHFGWGAGVQKLTLLTNSVFFVHNAYGYTLTNLVNVQKTGELYVQNTQYITYICTAPTASATQPTD